MQVIATPTGGGKTTALIGLAAGRQLVIVCASRDAASRILERAHKSGLTIPKPITYREFLEGGIRGRGGNGFVIDDVDLMFEQITHGLPVHAVSLTVARTSHGVSDKQSLKAAAEKYLQLGREIAADASVSDLQHTHSKLGIFLDEAIGADWREAKS